MAYATADDIQKYFDTTKTWISDLGNTVTNLQSNVANNLTGLENTLTATTGATASQAATQAAAKSNTTLYIIGAVIVVLLLFGRKLFK
jgi:hypothetical protein